MIKSWFLHSGILGTDSSKLAKRIDTFILFFWICFKILEARSSLCTPSVRCAVHPLFTRRLNFSRWWFSILSKTVLFCRSVSCCVIQCCVGEKLSLTSQWTGFFVNVLEGVNCSTVNCSIFSTELLWDTSISVRVHCRSWLKSNEWHCFSFVPRGRAVLQLSQQSWFHFLSICIFLFIDRQFHSKKWHKVFVPNHCLECLIYLLSEN